MIYDNYSKDNPEFVNLWQVYQQEKPTHLDFVLPGLLAGSVGAIISPGGVGKSWVATMLCMSLATSHDLLNIGITQHDMGNVAYFNAEDPRSVSEWRMWHILRRISPNLIGSLMDPHRYIYATLLGMTPQIMDNQGKRDEGWIHYIKSWAQGRKLIIIDTLRKFHQGLENDSGQMTAVTQILDEIAVETGAAVLFCHHSNKLAMSEGTGDEAGASRGSSALVDNIRWQLNLISMSKKEAEAYSIPEQSRRRYMRLVGAKMNYGDDSADWWLYKGKNGVPEPVKLEKKDNGGKDEY